MTEMMTRIAEVFLWGFVATLSMTTIMLGAQGLGLSRLSLPFLFGTAAADRLRPAYVSGYLFYAIGGFAFAFLYDALFVSMGRQSWWIGALMGALHGLFLLTALTHIAMVHPRIASDYDRPGSGRFIEPPGFLGLHYGRQTPVITVFAHAVFGAILGLALPAL